MLTSGNQCLKSKPFLDTPNQQNNSHLTIVRDDPTSQQKEDRSKFLDQLSLNSLKNKDYFVVAATLFLMVVSVITFINFQPDIEKLHFERMSTWWGASINYIAVTLLVLEGIKDNVWNTKNEDKSKADLLINEYNQEIVESNKRVAGKGVWDKNRRSTFSLGGSLTLNSLRGDYPDIVKELGATANFKYLFSDYFNLSLSYGYQNLGSPKYFKSQFTSAEADLEYLMLPFNNFTPYFSAGIGSIKDIKTPDKQIQFKTQVGAGLELLVAKNVGIRGFAKYHMGFNDDWDNMVSGKRDDHFLQYGIGLQVYLGK